MKTVRLRKTIAINFIFLITIILSVGFSKPSIHNQNSQAELWVAPPEADKIKNPFAGDKKSTDDGKALYQTYCIQCHGKEGHGDGRASQITQVKPTDHTLKKIQKQSDGSLYWKITEGKEELDMRPYKIMLSDEERWALVNYIRSIEEN